MESIKQNSNYSHFPSYKIRAILIKGGDDLRQEVIAIQIMEQFVKIFDVAKLKIHLRPYNIIVTSANSGVIGSQMI
jgi:phosphatidylinositol 4-kinase